MDILHITNGDSAVMKMHEAGIEGNILPWRDVLHDGRVLPGDDLEAVSKARAGFIASLGWADEEQVRQDFAERDAQLQRAAYCDRIILWFEHDLYDQLQILQLLNWFAGQPQTHDRLHLLNHNNYLGVIGADEMATLAGTEQRVTREQLNLARKLWQTFTDDTPHALVEHYRGDTGALPFMHDALYRLLQFLPSPRNGLNRTEHQALQAAARGITAPDNLFEASQQAEQARFLGDASFWLVLEELCSGEQPLLQAAGDRHFSRPTAYPYGDDFMAPRLRLTEYGRAVLNGEQDALTLREIDRWIGGFHVHPGQLWRWDSVCGELV